MQLTDTTINVLRNYASINPNIVFNEGNTLKTISVARNVLSTTELTETFPQKFGIYDLNEFLNTVSLCDEPRLKFEADYVVVTDSTGRSSAKYFYSDPEMLTSPGNAINMPDAEVKDPTFCYLVPIQQQPLQPPSTEIYTRQISFSSPATNHSKGGQRGAKTTHLPPFYFFTHHFYTSTTCSTDKVFPSTKDVESAQGQLSVSIQPTATTISVHQSTYANPRRRQRLRLRSASDSDPAYDILVGNLRHTV